MSKEIFRLIDRACHLLLIHGRNEKGFYQQQIGVPGKPASPTVANIILALYQSGKLDEKQVEVFLTELLNLQDPKTYLFCRNEGSSTWATSKALITILSVAPEKIRDERILNSVVALIETQNTNGGWGYTKGYINRPYYCYFAVKALTLAYMLCTDNKIKCRLRASLKRTATYLKKTMIEKGVWGKKEKDTHPCALSTLLALGALKEIEKCFLEKLIDEDMLECAFEIVNELGNVNNWKKYVIRESGIPFSIQPSIPGKLPIILDVFGRGELSYKLVQWLLKNYKEYNDGVGWCPTECGEENPYTWTTALCILGLLRYLKELKRKPIAYKIKRNNVIRLWILEAKNVGMSLVKSKKLLFILGALNFFVFLMQLFIFFNSELSKIIDLSKVVALTEILSLEYKLMLVAIIQVATFYLSAQFFKKGDVSLRKLGADLYRIYKIVREFFGL
jgi:hypothetical protein